MGLFRFGAIMALNLGIFAQWTMEAGFVLSAKIALTGDAAMGFACQFCSP